MNTKGHKMDSVRNYIADFSSNFLLMVIDLLDFTETLTSVSNMILPISNPASVRVKMKVHSIYLTTLKFSIKKRFLNRFSKIEQVR